MEIKKGDLVTRISYNHDTVFKVINIKDNKYYLKGVEFRLYADAEKTDLQCISIKKEEKEVIKTVNDNLERNNDFFYLPAKILHIDGDSEYLGRCLNFYKENNVYAVGKRIKENFIAENLKYLLTEYKPDIVIITGHDAYYKKKGSVDDIRNYKNTLNFVNAVKVARTYEKSHDKLVIIAGACQSNYEELIKAGANFASSPKRVNIHALDPAIIAVTLAKTQRNVEINLIDLLKKTKNGEDGMGGILCNGLMYVGYPR